MPNGVPPDHHGCLANEPSRSRRNVGAGLLLLYEMRGAGLQILRGCDERNCTFWTIIARFVPIATGRVCGAVLPEMWPRIPRYLVAARRAARGKWASPPPPRAAGRKNSITEAPAGRVSISQLAASVL